MAGEPNDRENGHPRDPGPDLEPALDAPLSLRVYSAARDGLTVTLYTLLAEQARPQQRELLNHITKDDAGQACPPLVIAAHHGHDKTVHTLIGKFGHGADEDLLDLEISGTVITPDQHVIEGATALWCAAAAGHLKVVKTLLKAGANVNRTTASGSTALRAACYGGHAEVVRYLIERGDAQVGLANRYDNTCLMIASYKGHRDIVGMLLGAGADVDTVAQCGATALHFAAEAGYLEIVKSLVEEGHASLNIVNDHGTTPVLGAADRCREHIVEYLLRKSFESFDERERKSKCVEALEMLGASYANDVDNYSPAKSYFYLERAMALRWSDPSQPILKPPSSLEPLPYYHHHVECQTMEDLEALRNDPDALHMEGLAVRERILGCQSSELPIPVIYRGAVFADNGDFERCVPLWLYALRLRKNTKSRIDKDVLRFTQLFCQIIDCSQKIAFTYFIEVFQTARDGLRCMTDFTSGNCCKINDKISRDRAELMAKDCSTEEDCMGMLMVLFLYLVVIFTKIRQSFLPDEDHEVMGIIHEVTVKVNPRTKGKRTLLHLAVDSATPVDNFHTNDLVRFPSANTAKILLSVGADPKCQDEDFNTPLHLIVGYPKVVSDFQSLHSIVAFLIQAGAHCDVVNKYGQTPMMKAATHVAQIILKSQEKINLKCLAARAVKKQGIEFKGHVPKDLEEFIDWH